MIERRQQPPCSIQAENVWGPQVHGCGTDFDLTLLFQEVVLFIVPLRIDILLALWRISHLARRQINIASPWLHGLKLVSQSSHCLKV